MPAIEAQKLVDEWRTRKVNALIAFTGNLFQRHGKTPSLVRDGVCAEMAEEGSRSPELAASSS
jgi:hypothetical protein